MTFFMNTACLALSFTLLAQTPTPTEADRQLILFPYYSRQAAAYEFFLDEGRQQRLELHRQPVLTWTNVDNYMGSVFVWTFSRPSVTGEI
jgi:hypothetical protein